MMTCSKVLRCPICKESLIKNETNYVCINKHSFDISKQGYTNLYLHNSSVSGDNKEMVEARKHFLSKGYYDPLLHALSEMLNDLQIKNCVDAGCGEGYYTRHLANNREIYAFDLSKDALRIASKEDKETNYFLSSIFDLPICNQGIDAVLNIFAPFASDEFKRILKDEGMVIKVDPNADHLYEMKEILYEKPYKNEPASPEGWEVINKKEICYIMELGNQDIRSLIKMTPYLFKTKKSSIEHLYTYNRLHVTASFIIYILKPID